jgi:hypothetical protein
MKIRVECYSGYRGEEAPRTILTENRKIEVKKIIDRWIAPDHRYFKLLGDDQAVYIIRHDQESWQWELIFYQIAEEPSDRTAEMNGYYRC